VKRSYRFSAKAGAVFIATVAILLTTTPGAFAGTRQVCNAAFCNKTSGNGGDVSSVFGGRRDSLRGVEGFFEAFARHGMKSTGPTNKSNTTLTSFTSPHTLKNGELMCLRFFAKNRKNQFYEVGTAQCTTAPF
jgi:hypothetical protein